MNPDQTPTPETDALDFANKAHLCTHSGIYGLALDIFRQRNAALAETKEWQCSALLYHSELRDLAAGKKVETNLGYPVEQLINGLRAEVDRLTKDIEKADQQEQLVADALPAEFEGCEENFGWMVNAVVTERDHLRAELTALRATTDADHAAAIHWLTMFAKHRTSCEFYHRRECTCGLAELQDARVTGFQQKGEQREALAAPQPAPAKKATVRSDDELRDRLDKAIEILRMNRAAQHANENTEEGSRIMNTATIETINFLRSLPKP